MADVPGKFFKATKVRTGVSPSSPGVIEGETLPPLNPPGGALNSVGLSMPSAFNVANSPLTSNGTLAVTGAGTVGQYIRGDGSLADFPQASGGGSSVSYYLNGSVNQGTIGGVAYRELSKVPILGAGTDFTINADGYIASFITDAGDPNLLEIPGGNWNFETYFSASSGGGSPTFYVELYKVSGTTATLIASSSSSPELIAFGTNLTPYYSTLAVPTTTLALTDRLAVRYYVSHSGRTITLHTENNHLCQIITTFTTGLTALNGLTAQVQNFAVGTSGTDFNIASATATHTFNLPTASATNRGALSSADWSLFRQAYNDKINSASVTGTTTKTLTLVQQDGGEIQASWSDLNTDAVTSVFGRTGAVVAVSGDYNTSQVTESGNLYFTQARVSANTDVAANTAARHNAVTLGTANGLSLSTQQLSLGLASGSATGALSSTDWNTFNNKENAITAGTTAQYFRGDKTFQTLNTAAVPESGNLYFTNARAIASTLTGYVSGAGTISSADSILTAIQKLNGNIGGLVTGVSSVNGQTGAVTLTTTNIGEGTNLYFTNARSRAALSFAAGSGAYNTTTGVITIPTDNNQIANGANYITAAALSAYLPLAGGTMTGVITTPNGTFGIVIGDDSRLADRNVANTLFLEGNQNTDRGYINFSQTSGNALGAVNGGDLTWRGNVVLHAANFNSYAPTLGGTGATGTWSIAITGNAGTANTWTTARTITIGNTGKSVNGSANVAWSLAEIGAYAASNPSAFIALTALSGVAPIQYNNTTGAISITQASGSTNGFLSSTDWNTFNNKQNALTNPVTGTGTTNYLPKFTGSTTIGNSNLINDASGNLGLGVTPPAWSFFRAINVLNGSFSTNSSVGGGVVIARNWYYDGAERYYENGTAQRLELVSNGFFFQTATTNSSGAGAALTWGSPMTLNNSGRLLLGTTDDNGARLQVSGTATFGGTIYLPSSIAGRTSQIEFGNLSSGDLLGMPNQSSTFFLSYGTNNIHFRNDNFGEILRLNNNGSVNFYSSLTATGNINSGSGTNQILLSSGNILFYNAATSNKFIQIGDDSSTINAIGFSKSGSVATTYFPSGNVGIGTTTIASALSGSARVLAIVDNATANLASVRVYGGGTSTSLELYGGASAVGLFGSTNHPMVFSTNNVEAMRIFSGQNVHIGPTPSSDNGARLQVSGTAGAGITLRHSNGNVIALLEEFSGTQGGALTLRNSSGTNNIQFNAGGVSYINGGNVGIGIDIPTGNANRILHINGADSAEIHLTRSNSGTSSTFGGYVNFDGSNNFNLQNRTGGAINLITGTTNALTLAASTGAATFSSTIRSNNTNGLGIGDIAGYRRIQYDLANTRFGLLTDGNALANLEAAAATFSSSVTAVNAVLGNTSNNTNAIQFLDANSTKTRLGSAFGATFIQNNNFFNGSSYVFDDNTIGSANVTLSAGTINFQTAAANTNPSTIARITTAGRLLLGDVSTDNGARLQVSGAGFFSNTVSNLNNLIYSGGSLFLRNPANTFDWALYQDSANNLKVDFNGATRLTLTSGGAATFSSSVTINNALIYNRVFSDILPANDAQGVIYVREGNVSGADGLRYASRTHLFQSHTGSNYLTIASSGNVGIGTPSPVARLHAENPSNGDPTSLGSVPTTNVFGFSTSPGAMLAAGIGTAGGGPHVWFQGRNLGGAGVSYPIAFQPLGGNVLIGTTTDSAGRLRVKASGNDTYAIAFERSNATTTIGGFYQNSGSSGELFLRASNGSDNVKISSTADSYWAAPGARFSIGTSINSSDLLRVAGNTFSNTIMTWNPENDNRSGVTWRLGAASIGSITPNRRLRVNVGGVEYFIGAVEV